MAGTDTATNLTERSIASRLAFLGRIDVFTIWVTVLLAIGLAVTGKVPRSRAAIAAGIVWLLGALPLLLQSRG